MNRYLEKISKEKDEKPGWGKSTLGYLAGVTSGTLATLPVTLAAGNSLMKEHYLNKNQVGNGTTEREFLKKHKLDLNIDKNHTNKYGPHFTYGHPKNIVYGSNNNGTHMHELGHALDLRNSSAFRHRAVNTAASVGGVGLMLKGVKDNNSAEIVGGSYLASAPVLKREAMANIHAYKAFKEFEGKQVANKFLKQLAIKNTIAHHTPVIGAALGAIAAAKIIHRKKNDE